MSMHEYKWWWSSKGNSFSFKNYLVILFFIFAATVIELNAFYLKHLLWIPIVHHINALRLILMSLLGVGAAREFYDFCYGGDEGRSPGQSRPCNRTSLGPFVWLALAVISTESIVCYKFGRGHFSNLAPQWVFNGWIAFISILVIFPGWQFIVRPRLCSRPS